MIIVYQYTANLTTIVELILNLMKLFIEKNRKKITYYISKTKNTVV